MRIEIGFKLVLLFILIENSIKISAQIIPPCQEPLRENKFFQCYAPFIPVCGCNFKTYRNDCESYNVYGVNTINNLGVCKNDFFYVDFYPNPCRENLNLAVEFFEQGNLSVLIYDIYGKLMHYTHRVMVHRYDDLISVGGFKPGLYVIIVISGNIVKSEKLMVRWIWK